MNALSTHLDDLLTVLRASADFDPAATTPSQMQGWLANELDRIRPDLAVRVRDLDDWHTEALAEFVAEAHIVAEALDGPPRGGHSLDDTRMG